MQRGRYGIDKLPVGLVLGPAHSFSASNSCRSAEIDNKVGGIQDAASAQPFGVFRLGELIVGRAGDHTAA